MEWCFHEFMKSLPRSSFWVCVPALFPPTPTPIPTAAAVATAGRGHDAGCAGGARRVASAVEAATCCKRIVPGSWSCVTKGEFSLPIPRGPFIKLKGDTLHVFF